MRTSKEFKVTGNIKLIYVYVYVLLNYVYVHRYVYTYIYSTYSSIKIEKNFKRLTKTFSQDEKDLRDFSVEIKHEKNVSYIVISELAPIIFRVN